MSFNEDQQLCFYPTQLNWLEEHDYAFQDYLNTFIDVHSREYVRNEFLRDPYLGKVVINDFIKNSENPAINLNALLEYIEKPEVFVILVLGMPGSGKTTSAYKLCELLKDKYNIVKVDLIKPEDLPDWVQWKPKPSKLTEGDLAILDESSIKNNARRSSSRENVEDLQWLAVGRQVGAKMIYITQLSSISDINIMRWTNIIISKGYSTSALGLDYVERKMISDNPIYKYLKPTENYAGVPSQEKEWCVCSYGKTTSMVRLEKPSFMTEKHSKPYKRFYDLCDGDPEKIQKMAMDMAAQAREADASASYIKRELDIRGFEKPLMFWKKFTGELEVKKVDDFD